MHFKMRGTIAVVIAFSAGCAVKRAAHNVPVTTATDWLAQQPVVCGEVRGRVLDARTGAPLAGVYVAIDSTSRAVSTDSLGQFRFNISPVDSNALSFTRAITVRIRRIGMLELRFHLHENLGYAVEASLGPHVFHVDGISTLRIKTPGFCERAT
jgi:hypothetical protein